MKLKSALPWCATGLLLILCLMLPLLFTGGGDGPEPTTERALTLARRAEIYSLFAADDLSFTRLDEDEVDNGEYVECIRTANLAMGALVMDSGETRDENPFGTNFYTLSDGGDTIRIMEYYYEWTGDWHNWFTMHIDLDTGLIYYLYYSAAVQSNGGLYMGRAEEHLAEAGEALTQELGFTGGSLDYDSDSRWELTLKRGGESYAYGAICGIYEDAAPSMIIDLRVTLASASGQ